jgi:hypothetical protein
MKQYRFPDPKDDQPGPKPKTTTTTDKPKTGGKSK